MREEDQLARFSDSDLASIINPASFFTSKSVAEEGGRFDEESADTFYFDTKINGLRFVGVPQSIRRYVTTTSEEISDVLDIDTDEYIDSEDEDSQKRKLRKTSKSKKQTKNQQPNHEQYGSFHICWVLRGIAGSEMSDHYQEFSRRLSVAINYQEECTNYLSNEIKKMYECHDKCMKYAPDCDDGTGRKNSEYAADSYKMIAEKNGFGFYLEDVV